MARKSKSRDAPTVIHGKRADLKEIKNKMIRSKLYRDQAKARNTEEHKMRHERAKMESMDPSLKEERLANNVPDTLDSKRVFDESIDAEKEGTDEFDNYFSNDKMPKILLTTSKGARKEAYELKEELLDILPNSEFIKRGSKFSLKEIAKFCNNRAYTDIVVINEDKKLVNGITFIHLPEGPTMTFSLTSLRMPKQISGHGRSTNHIPELILNNFSTSMGVTVGRLFQSLFPKLPEFVGRQAVTLHNQRDYIFFRRHRYIFKNKDRVGLQELGPQFTLKLRKFQKGIYEEVEWEHKSGMDKEKRKFFL
ncbi:anticodon-binding protein [Dipodascopsis tothii]|uniref:anticodon-binding protein n=1 Tax=Dipodascopsis tothii TaxID=44089 RepID=UPI0034CE33E3